MEVILRQIPVHLTDEQLKRELRPFMTPLGIMHYWCEKARKSKIGYVNFGTRGDGERFLKRHREISNQKTASTEGRGRRSIARLHILKTAVFVEESPRKVDALVINGLELERERMARLGPRDPKLPPIQASASSIACGKHIFVFDGKNEGLTFVQEAFFQVQADNVLQFGRQYVTLTLGAWRMDMANATIKELITDARSITFTFVLTEVPRFYQKLTPEEAKAGSHGHASWARKTSIDIWPGHAKSVAGCLVYRICLLASKFHDTRDGVKSRDTLTVNRQTLALVSNPRAMALDYGTALTLFQTRLNSFSRARDHVKVLPFVILFQVEALVLNDNLHPTIATKLLEALQAKALECGEGALPFTAQAMRILHQTIPIMNSEAISSQLDHLQMLNDVINREVELRKTNPERDHVYGPPLAKSQVWVLKAMVTPTRILLSGPDPESKNRVLRDFEDYSDYFLRVTFGDEGGGDLPFNPRVSNRLMFDRYRSVLDNGIRIAGRHYAFLGFSHSSLRSHSAWFSAPFTDYNWERHNADSIIKNLGDFSRIQIAAKCAARIGQAFSETPWQVDLVKNKIQIDWINDVEYDNRVFSDGVGTISREAMEVIWWNIPRQSQTPTCFQIRLGGIKGMLSLDSRLKGRRICIRRKSMMKFESKKLFSLGICDTASQPLRMFLNRQLIKILEDMGTPDAWFLEQQQKALRELRKVTAAVPNTCTFLEQQDVGKAAGLPRLIRLLHKMDISYRQDTFMKSVVEHVVLQELRLLKHKARIPMDQGVTLFGVMDETGFLEEGEIFVTWDTGYDRNQRRVENSLRPKSNVIVTRSPALHPGDIQYVKMANPPVNHPLRRLQNCVIFSQKGTRDLPSQLAGGDLDGDLYSVIWDPQVRPLRCFAAADYPRATPPGLGRVVTRKDIAEFFVNFMETDILGLIAIRHQVLADIQPLGTNDPACIELAELHSTAVDYSKTGIPVKVTELPKAKRTRPDFLAPAPSVKLVDQGQIDQILDEEQSEDEDDGMGIAKHLFHRSDKILGRLYRNIDEQKIWSEEIKQPALAEGPSVWDQFLSRVQINVNMQGYQEKHINHKRRHDRAWTIRNFYEAGIRDFMDQYSQNPKEPLKEVEVFCGSIFKSTGAQSRQEHDSSVKLKEAIDGHINHVVKLIRDGSSDATAGRDAALQPPSGDPGEQARMSAVELCWACVVVGCSKAAPISTVEGGQAPRKNQETSSKNHGPAELESFRVVAASCLARELTELLAYSTPGQDYGGGYLGKNGHMVLAMR